MARKIRKGATDISVILRAIDSTTGAPKTDFAYNTAGIDLWYRRNGATVTSITEATLAAVDSAHSDGGVIHLGNGYFRLDAPDAAFATGANHVFFGGTATGVIIIGTEIQLVNYDPEDAVRLGLTALPPADADAPGGIPISDAGGLDLDAIKVKTDALPSGIKKGIAINNFMIYMKSSTDHISGATGLTVSGQIAGDAGSFDSLTGTITEVAYGLYRINTITTSETNFDIFTLRFTATGADPAIYEFKTIS